MKMFRNIAATLVVVFVAGCSGFIATPDTDRQNLAAVEITFTELVSAANDLADEGVLEGDVLNHVQNVVATGSAALDAAHSALLQNDRSSFERWFATVEAAVVELRRTFEIKGEF